jgi:membrane protease YdiL (CAAX protease family)
VISKILPTLRNLPLRSAVLALCGLIAWDIYGLDFIPFTKTFGDTPWNGISYHAVSGVCSVGLMAIFCPGALSRLRFYAPLKETAVGLVVICLVSSSFFWEVRVPGFPAWEIAEAILFTIMIGVGEDFFNRGLIFGMFERFGWGLAIAVSSVTFGLEHYTNMLWGGQDFAQTNAQVIDAAAFGVVGCSLMIYTGNIWFSVVMHGTYDFSLVTTSHIDYVKQLSARVDWVPIFIEAVVYLTISAVLLRMAKLKNVRRVARLEINGV